MEQSKRLFISGIPPEANEDEIKKRFEAFGAVFSVEKLVKNRDGFPTKCFAYLDISLTDASYRKCVSVYSKAKWKGCQMAIEPAKKNFIKCLEDERQQHADKKPTKASSPPPSITSELRVKSRDGKCLLNVSLKKNAKQVKKFAGQSSASDQVSVNDLSWDLEPGSDVPSENSPPVKKVKEDNLSKRSTSNNVRLKALEKSKQQQNKSMIVDKPKANSHVVFEQEEEAKSSTDESSSNIPKEKSPLPLFGSDSESDDIDNNDVVRPQFEGEEGAKLFKLQQKIGWDKRFELDERFLSSSSDGSLSESEEESSVEQDVDDNGELKKEQQRNLELINEMFGNTSSLMTPKAHGGMIELQRYDPSAADSELLEKKPLPVKTKKTKAVSPTTDSTTIAPSNIQEAEETVPKPVVSQDHFYSVSDTLKDVLRPDNQGYTFSFTSSTTKDDSSSKTATSVNTPSWLNALQNGDEDSSSSGEDISDLPPASDIQKRTSLFFFHANSPQLRNRLDAPETKFHRTCSLEELEKQWPEKRTRLKEQYKRRRRDAIRWLRQRKQIK